jgi:hypothetical protein
MAGAGIEEIIIVHESYKRVQVLDVDVDGRDTLVFRNVTTVFEPLPDFQTPPTGMPQPLSAHVAISFGRRKHDRIERALRHIVNDLAKPARVVRAGRGASQ